MDSKRIFKKSLEIAVVTKESAIWDTPFYETQYQIIKLLEYINPGDVIFIMEKRHKECYVISKNGVMGWISSNDII